MIIYGSGMSNGNGHDPINLPILLLGGGCGQIKSGRHLKYGKDTPLANLHLTLLDKLGVHADNIGDSTGEFDQLSGVDKFGHYKGCTSDLKTLIGWWTLVAAAQQFRRDHQQFAAANNPDLVDGGQEPGQGCGA